MIKASSAREIDALVADLSSERAVTRDSAVARLTVIGSRAIERVIRVASSGNALADARIAAFRTLEAIADPRALPPAVAALADADPAIATAALHTASVFLVTPQGVDALDRVTEIALDRRRDVSVRVAAVQALTELPAATVRPIIEALKNDPDPEIANLLQPARRRAMVNPGERLAAAATGTLPTEAVTLRSALARSGTEVPVSMLHQIIEQIRVHEGSETPPRRASWVAARAATHLALAQRGSRLALYDLRETIESSRDRIPVEFFAAVTAIGDTTCLEPIAAAYSRVKDDWSQRHLADAFRAIVSREQVTRRHAVARKIEKRWPGRWTAFVAT